MIEPLPDLETKCKDCNGRGWFTADEGGRDDCAACGGSGFVPTAIGARVLDLVRHNSRVNVSAELRVSSGR